MELNQPVDPEIAVVLATLPVGAALDETTLAASRSRTRPAPVLSGTVKITEHVAPADPPVPVRVHRRTDAPVTGIAALISLHGGGLVLGSYADDDAILDSWCSRLDLVGVAVEYRLAPETRYPGALEDAYAALLWTYKNAAELGIDPSRIGVRGASAGGGLAAALCLLARDRGEVPVAFQLLDCPMLDDRQCTPSSRQDGLLVWSRESNAFGWRSYLGELYGTEVPYTAAPARALDLTGLPPTFVSVGSTDGFRDEDIDYALRLNQAGVPCELHVYPGAPHGYGLAPNAAVSGRSRTDQLDWLTRQLGG
jgi:acetyl esterase/lipase